MCQALPHGERPDPFVEGGRPRSGDGTLLCLAQLPGALESVAANGLIGINSIDFGAPGRVRDQGLEQSNTTLHRRPMPCPGRERPLLRPAVVDRRRDAELAPALAYLPHL